MIVPATVISVARKRRMATFTRQMPEALEVGHPLSVTISNVASDMADPVGTEFGMVKDQISYGDTIVDAFSDLADRADIEDVRNLAVSIGIQHGTGGNLTRVRHTSPLG